MNLEQLALFAIAVFSFMALAAMFNTFLSVRRMGRGRDFRRMRRAVKGEDSARSVARSVVREVAENNSEEVRKSRLSGRPTAALQEALDEARAYFSERVDPRLRSVFNDVVNEMILVDPDGENREEGQ